MPHATTPPGRVTRRISAAAFSGSGITSIANSETLASNEAVARAIHASPIPVISAVGHEIDFTLCDFAADLRAETPTAAVWQVCVGLAEIIGHIEGQCADMSRILSNKIDGIEMRLNSRLNRINNTAINKINNAQAALKQKMTIIEKIAPMAILERGFAIIEKNGKSVNSANLLKEGDEIVIRFGDSTKKARII